MSNLSNNSINNSLMSKVTNVTYENNTKIQLYFEKVYFVVLHIKKEKYMIKENKISKIDKMNFSPSNLKYELQEFHNFFELTNFKEPIDVQELFMNLLIMKINIYVI